MSIRAINFNFLFAITSDENCAQNFYSVSQAMIDSPSNSPEIKEIFERFQAAIRDLKPCVINADVDCIKNAFVNVGVRGMKEGFKATTGTEQQLFKRMLIKDVIAVSKLNKLQPSDGQEAVQIANDAFCTKAEWIRAFLESFAQ